MYRSLAAHAFLKFTKRVLMEKKVVLGRKVFDYIPSNDVVFKAVLVTLCYERWAFSTFWPVTKFYHVYPFQS